MQDEACVMLTELPHLSVFMDLWAKEDRDTIYRRLQYIMHALSKSSPDIGVTAITIDRGKKAEAINDETVVMPNLFASLKCRIAHRGPLELGLNRAQMLLVYLVWCDDQLEVLRRPIEIGKEYLFILGPSASSHKDPPFETGSLRDVFSLFSNLKNSIEACIPRDTNLLHTELMQ